MTQQEFAKWSFERDLHAGCFEGEVPRIRAWHNLLADEQEMYMEEADMYMKMPMKEWPVDILERIK